MGIVTAADPERIVGLYERHVEAWDRQRSRTLFERPWLDRFADLLPAAGSVLDIGCGAGEPIAAHLLGRSCRVTAIIDSRSSVAADASIPITKLYLGKRLQSLREQPR